MEKNLLNQENAVKEVLVTLKQLLKYRWKNIHYINERRYALVTGEPNIAILFKRDLFQSFGRLLKKEGAVGVGESINCKHLSEFMQNKVISIYTIFPNGRIYTIKIEDFLKQSIKWRQKEGTDVRSISIHALARVNP